jgi:tRNA(Ile)-lysidine synthase
VRLTPGWLETVHRRLDERLASHDAAPLALALSGGGDSVALLHVAADWAARRGRRILALTVDHRLHPDSSAWTAFAERAAHRVGAHWRGWAWVDAKPSTGLPAAARSARHALLAQAARTAGARVLLMAHTADDRAEGDWMRGEGAPVGRLRDWSPSPAWPEGRGLMLLRPMLDVTRADLRAFLVSRDADWIDDPANADARYHRVRARAALGGAVEPARPEPDRGSLDLVCDPLSGVIRGPRNSPWLGHAVVCASGRASLPAPQSVERARLRLEDAGKVSLSGAVLGLSGDQVTVARERGRQPAADLDLTQGRPMVWDGRFEILTSRSGWRVGAAAGRRDALSAPDRRRLSALPPMARPSHPVLFREDGSRPVLADPSVEARCLVPDRLRLATGGAQREDDLGTPLWRGPPHRPI